MQKIQESFIDLKLNELDLCDIDQEYTEKLKQVSTQAIRTALNEKYMNGADMKAILCVINTAVLAARSSRASNGIYRLGTGINEWIKEMKKMKVTSVEGFVYVTDFFSEGIEVIIKVPQEASLTNNKTAQREYFLGIMVINGLRYLLPSFVYTLGAFMCGKPKHSVRKGAYGVVKELCAQDTPESLFVVYEKVSGGSETTSVKQALKTEWDFPVWLCFFAQLLLSLEVAQREIRFTHFDLHDSNVMVRENNEAYEINLDGTTYRVAPGQASPVIIDFGMTAAVVDGMCIGSFSYASHGMLSFMVPGFDMYKFMVYSARTAYGSAPSLARAKAVDSISNGISDIFAFYGGDDPYRIFTQRAKGVRAATNEFCRDVTYSNAATRTPLMLYRWLLEQYPDILTSVSIAMSPRQQYRGLRYSNTMQEYEDLFGLEEKGRCEAIETVKRCITVTPSYIMTMYNLKLLDGYNRSLESADITASIATLNRYLEYAEQLIEIDKRMLEKVFVDVKIPDSQLLEERCREVLDTRIRHWNAEEKSRRVRSLREVLRYRNTLKPYFQLYYTILELHLDDVFREWIAAFTSSAIFAFNAEYEALTEQASRWAETMECSVANVH
jgi:hypothetical protein